MSDTDRRRWDARHAAAEDVVPLPPDVLRGREDLVPTGGRALDVACGRGAVALWLARRGLVVDAVDVSPVALAAAARRAADLPVRWRGSLDVAGGCAASPGAAVRWRGTPDVVRGCVPVR